MVVVDIPAVPFHWLSKCELITGNDSKCFATCTKIITGSQFHCIATGRCNCSRDDAGSCVDFQSLWKCIDRKSQRAFTSSRDPVQKWSIWAHAIHSGTVDP